MRNTCLTLLFCLLLVSCGDDNIIHHEFVVTATAQLTNPRPVDGVRHQAWAVTLHIHNIQDEKIYIDRINVIWVATDELEHSYLLLHPRDILHPDDQIDITVDYNKWLDLVEYQASYDPELGDKPLYLRIEMWAIKDRTTAGGLIQKINPAYVMPLPSFEEYRYTSNPRPSLLVVSTPPR